MQSSLSVLKRAAQSVANAKPSRSLSAASFSAGLNVTARAQMLKAFSTKAAPKAAKAPKATKAAKSDASSPIVESSSKAKSGNGNVQLVKGTTLDTHSLDFRTARVGQVLEVPYELTMDASWSNLWQSKFFQHDRLYTSKVFAQQLGFGSFLLPYTMLLFHTGSMSHLDDERAVLDLGFRNAVYENPAVPGETFKKVFTIKGLRPTADNKRTVITVHCELINVVTNVRVFSVDKRMIYPERLPDSHYVREPAQPSPAPLSNVLEQLEEQAATLTEARWRSLVNLEAGQLALHTQCRRLGLDNHLNLCTQARLTHPLILNTVRIKTADIAIPGGVLLPLAHSATARDTYEVLYEQIDNASFLNPANPDDTIGAFSFVHDVEEREHLQIVSLQTFGVKNLDVQTDLAKVKLPVTMFTREPLKPREYDEILAEHCPQLKDKLVTVANRKLYRLSSYGSHSRIFLL